MKFFPAAVILSAFLLSSCAVRHVKPYEPKHRDYEPIADEPETAKQADRFGSIWSDRGEGGTLFTDVRAFKINDIVTIRIQEVAKASRDAQTTLDREAAMAFGGDMLGLAKKNEKKIGDPENLVNGKYEHDFQSQGKTSRSDEVRFTIAATITKVLPNGNLFIEGYRVVLVNNEEHHFYISGVARPEDIERDNSIVSYQLADAQVEFTGRGVISEEQDPGWLTRAMNYISPF